MKRGGLFQPYATALSGVGGIDFMPEADTRLLLQQTGPLHILRGTSITSPVLA
ncbi:MAG TPA: hypothetical protein GX004_07665 [Firmicutes bacterium]|nr:hypothetical protein [Bacillota bacterium]